jgi:hypothetical protein
MVGLERDIKINLNGQDVDDCFFYNVTIFGAQGGTGTSYAKDCNFGPITNFSFYADSCSININGKITPRSSATSVLINPSTYRGELLVDWAEIDFTGKTNCKVLIQGARGPWLVCNSTHAGNVFDFDGIGATLISQVTNTAGACNILGAVLFTEVGTWTSNDLTYITVINALDTRLTAARAGYLDNINQAGLIEVTAARAVSLNELGAANIPADIDTLIATRCFSHYSLNVNQANPVQNTWYTALDTQLNCRINSIFLYVADTNETLEIKITIDGITLSASIAATFATYYGLGYNYESIQLISTVVFQNYRGIFIEGKSIKIEYRKTTAAGTGTIYVKGHYEKL